MAACSSALSATLANSFLIKNNTTTTTITKKQEEEENIIEEDEEMISYELNQVLRSKGIIWIAGKNQNCIYWNQTRNYINLTNG